MLRQGNVVLFWGEPIHTISLRGLALPAFSVDLVEDRRELRVLLAVNLRIKLVLQLSSCECKSSLLAIRFTRFTPRQLGDVSRRGRFIGADC